MSAIEVVRIPVGPGRLAALGEAIAVARERYLAPPRCESVEVLGSEELAEAIVIVRWASRAEHDAAAAEPAAGAFFGRVSELTAGAPAVGWYEGLG